MAEKRFERLQKKCITEQRKVIIEAYLRRSFKIDGFSDAVVDFIVGVFLDGVDRAEKEFGLKVESTPSVRWPAAKLQGEMILDYIERVHGETIRECGMKQADLKRVDPRAYRRLHNYCHERGIEPRTIIPSSHSNSGEIIEAARASGEELTWAASVGAYRRDPTPENYARMRAYNKLHRRRQL
jgi:hypothetical protein